MDGEEYALGQVSYVKNAGEIRVERQFRVDVEDRL